MDQVEDFVNSTTNTIQNILNISPVENKTIDYSKYTEICPYKEFCKDYIEKDNSIFCKKCERKVEAACNYNKICEGFESSCSDCQCFDGVLCGGICYRNTNSVCEEEFLLEKRERPENSLEFEINFPHFISIDEWSEGDIVIINNNQKEVKDRIYLDLEDLEADIDLDETITLKPGERKTINLKIRGTDISNSVKGRTFLEKELETASLLIGSNKNSLKKEFVVYDIGVKCGEGHFNYKGVCVGDIFFLEGDCLEGEDCVDKMSFFLDRTKGKAARGRVKVGFAIINLENSSLYEEKVLSVKDSVSEWYRLEGIKYTGKDILNLSIEYIGSFNFPGINLREDLGFTKNFQSSETYKRLDQEADLGKYNILIIIVPALPATGTGEVGGLTYQGKYIALNAAFFTDMTVAHELSHVFGCKDLYEKFHLCKERWRGSLLCEERGKEDIWRVELGNCAAEIGWGDLNNNGVIDIEES